MLFNSSVFILFFLIVFFVYWFILNKKLQQQNIFLAIVSFIFYGWWDWRFLILLFISLSVDFYLGKIIAAASDVKKRKQYIILSVIFNLGLLSFFKYFNFFIDSSVTLLQHLGFQPNISTLNIILPVGISFYTFQSLSYTIDIYRKQIQPSASFINYAAFVSFFPQLVAGPIERAKHLIPQFEQKRVFNYANAVEGMHLILWGFFKKVVVADLCSIYVNEAFENAESKSGMMLIVPVFYFAFQIYGDFSGYTDIARGTAKLLGFNFMLNFKYPYFSRDIAEFWRRWHISLSTWFRDYLYFPLGGSKMSKYVTIRNTFVIFIVSGFWHGANYTFIIWGLLHAIFYLPLLITNKNRNHINVIAFNTNYPSLKETIQIASTFLLVSFAWIFFRADNLNIALQYIQRMFIWNGFTIIGYTSILPLILFMLFVEWVGRKHDYPLLTFINTYKWLKYPSYIFIFLWVYANFSKENSFIYFQF